MNILSITEDNILSFSHLFFSGGLERIQKNTCFGFGAEENHLVVGAVLCDTLPEEGVCYVYELYVEPEKRRCGIGTALVKAVSEEAAEDNLDFVCKTARNQYLADLCCIRRKVSAQPYKPYRQQFHRQLLCDVDLPRLFSPPFRHSIQETVL